MKMRVSLLLAFAALIVMFITSAVNAVGERIKHDLCVKALSLDSKQLVSEVNSDTVKADSSVPVIRSEELDACIRGDSSSLLGEK
jgi:hypothetical protein